ncbi:FAD-dependent oxidoreductase, partial [Pseudomonas protegens]
MGAATLYQLAKRGVKVAGIDRFASPHDQGSSHGDTRITRQAVGEGAAYVPLAIRSQQIWRELETELDVPLFEQCGVLVMTASTDPQRPADALDFTDNSIDLARRYGIEHEVLDAADIRQRFPQFAPLAGSARGYFEPGGGFVRPERCIDAQLTRARQLGATLISGQTVLELKPGAEGVEIISTGSPIKARQVIVSAG